MKSPEVIYFEGLPRSGKTSLTKQIATEHPEIFEPIGEYVHHDLLKKDNVNDQKIFIVNDELKYQLARECGKRCLVDRGHLSTVLYSHADTLVRGKHNLSFVDDWYFGRILRAKMLPDLYVLLDIPAELSLARKTTPYDTNNMWDNIEALRYVRENYYLFMNKYEPSVPVLVLDSSSMNLVQLKDKVVTFLGVNTNQKAANL